MSSSRAVNPFTVALGAIAIAAAVLALIFYGVGQGQIAEAEELGYGYDPDFPPGAVAFGWMRDFALLSLASLFTWLAVNGIRWQPTRTVVRETGLGPVKEKVLD